MIEKSATRYESTQVLERGDIYFAYRPKVERKDVSGFRGVQRLFMVLNPDGHGGERFRLIPIGRKRLPEVEDGGQRFWGFVDMGARAQDVRAELGPETYQNEDAR